VLIAEIGNNHFGDFDAAKTLIRQAHAAGADLIKGQCFKAKDISGSMPRHFYETCEFSVDQYLELIEYARSIGNDLFYSVFSVGFEPVIKAQSWHKIAAPQTRSGHAHRDRDEDNVIISVPAHLEFALPKFKRAEVLHTSEYLTSDPQLWHIQTLTDYLGRTVGYSDHTIGIGNCVRARELWGARVIEKHFCLKQNQSFAGVEFRDTVHGATPRQFEKLARELSK
jgi:sialic acid synthase SpsE